MNHASFIWNIAESLRGPYRPNEYGDVVLPFTVLRRMEQVLAETKPDVLTEWDRVKDTNVPAHIFLTRKAGVSFYNTSPYDLQKLAADSDSLQENLIAYVDGFSENVRDIYERFNFTATIQKLADKDKLLSIVQKFAATDLHPSRVSNMKMGHIFEELIRRFNEESNETAGDHFTPRDVISLMVQMLFTLDDDALQKHGTTRTIYDPTAGTGGMLSVADDYLRGYNPGIDLNLYGQDINDMSYAICKADMIIKGQGVDNIVRGNTLTQDGFEDKVFDYAMSNPPFGVDWKDEQKTIVDEHKRLGHRGRFGPGLPRVSDGALLFLMHLVKKMRPASEGGARVGVVLNGSPLFSGGAGSGESNIRQWLLDEDLVEAIVALPKDMFYNTGIATYIWILTNRKDDDRVGKVQLIDGSNMFHKLRKGVGSKRNEMRPENISELVERYYEFAENGVSKIFNNQDFKYRTITIERPLRLAFHHTPERVEAALNTKQAQKLSADDFNLLKQALTSLETGGSWKSRTVFQNALSDALKAHGLKLGAPVIKALLEVFSERDHEAELCLDRKGNPEPDTTLRDTENVPWGEDVDEYFEREVKPYAPEAWVDHSKTKEGAEIPFTRHFYVYEPPRTLEEIDHDLDQVMARLRIMLNEVEQ